MMNRCTGGKAMKTKRTGIVLLAGLLGLSAISCFGGGGREAAPATSAQPATTVVIQDKGGFADAIAAVADAAKQSVVHIDITGTVLQQAPAMGPFGMLFGAPSPQKVPIRALGSGVLISSEGYIVTNNHVVENADSIQVLFHDGSQEPAKIVGQDPFTDLAVVKVENARNVPPVTFGDSDAMKVGDWVVAIGNPRGLDWTVTAGIVSATHRTTLGVAGPTGFQDYIQTDAAINPGNSGGPLLNLNAQVIGLNSLIISQSQGSEGLGFAIPSRMVKSISDSLIRNGKVIRGDLGISFQDITPQIIKGLKLPKDVQGVVVVEVIPDGPGAAAGLQQGDVISMYQGKSVSSAYQLLNSIAQTAPGTKVTITVLRNNRERKLSATLADQLELLKKEAAHPAYELLGLKVEPVTAALAKQFGLAQPMGVVVTAVVPGSPADSAGIVKGDAIFRVGSDNVSNAQQFSKLVGEAIKTGTVLLLIRDSQSGQMGYLQIPID
jgi:serine protease Do